MVAQNKIQTYMLTLIIPMMMLPFSANANGGNLSGEYITERSIISYSVSNKSWLSLRGTTNINSFECLSVRPDSKGYILADVNLNENRVDFSGADIVVNVGSFDCKNPHITRDMRKALGGGENSGIEIRLLDVKTGEQNWSSADGNIIANLLITINGVSKTKELDIDWQRQGFEYSFKGTADLSMIDFNIDPPSPLIGLGLVRVNDRITVNFNYNVQSEEISRLD